MVLSFEGRVLSDQEERQIVDIISANSRLKIVCIMGKDEETERNFVKDAAAAFLPSGSDGERRTVL